MDAMVPATIGRSWARCTERGLHTDRLDVPFDDFDAEGWLAHAAAPLLESLAFALADEPISIMICDEAGVVMTRSSGDRSILRALDAVALAPGSVYSEAAVGTNGFGLALIEDRPALVAGADHYNRQLSAYTCAGAPIHDRLSGAVIGALSLTTWSDRRPGLLLALAAQVARGIEHELVLSATPVAAPLTRIQQLERDGVVASLRHAQDVGAAARDLGVSRATMYRKIKQYGIRGSEELGRWRQLVPAAVEPIPQRPRRER